MQSVHVKQEPGERPVTSIKRELQESSVQVRTEVLGASRDSSQNTRQMQSVLGEPVPSTSSAVLDFIPFRSGGFRKKSKYWRGRRNNPNNVKENTRTQSVSFGSVSSTSSSVSDSVPLRSEDSSRKNRRYWRDSPKNNNISGPKNGRVQKRMQKFKKRRWARRGNPEENIPMSYSPVPDVMPSTVSTSHGNQASADNDEIQVVFDSEIAILAEVNPKLPAGASSGSSEAKTEDSSNKENQNRSLSTERPKRKLRPIIIDGSNVAMGHGLHSFFSWRGIQICVDYFQRNGHQEITVFVPNHRKCQQPPEVHQIMEDLERRGILAFTPSRYVDGQLMVSEDDRFIVEYATRANGIIVSRDQYRDIMQENDQWRQTIKERLLQYTFVGDTIMFPLDPLGRDGPHLSDFLSFPVV